jgi:Tfp pilus assembly PilM family ATPase
MPQFLAIEWDAAECRMAVATLRGRQAVIEHAFAVSRGADDSPEDIGARIAKELDAKSCGRPEALVSVGRTRIELRQFTVPPAAEDDLPDLVRFQAAREFNELDDQWRLDFMPIETAGDGPKVVLATAIAPAEIAAIEKVCERAGLVLRRVLLRPCETASLLSASADKSPQLLIELFAGEVDLTVVSGDTTVFLRTTRFAGERPPLPALIAEIRLTLAAARNQLGGEKIDSLVLCGREPADEQLADCVKTELGVPVTLLDPFAGLTTAPSLARAMPAHSARYAPLLGMLQTELRGTRHPIDFLNPRRRPPPVNRRKLWISLGAAAAVLLLAYLIYGRVEHYWLASEVAEMKTRSNALDELLKKGTKPRARTAEIAKWADQETIWLDELYGLSRGIPAAKDTMLSDLTLSTGLRGSQIDMKGWTRNAKSIEQMEEGVRPLVGKMNTKDSHEDSTVSPYSWKFEAAVIVEKEPSKDAAKAISSGPTKPPAKGTAP